MAKSRTYSKRSTPPYNHLPVRVSEQMFDQYFLPFLSLPARGPLPKIPLFKIFNYILYQLHTGCQWDEIPISVDREVGKPEISTSAIWKWFHRWSTDRSFEFAFVNSVKELRDRKKLRLKRLHGDGTNTVAKKGVKTLDTLATNIKKAAKL